MHHAAIADLAGFQAELTAHGYESAAKSLEGVIALCQAPDHPALHQVLQLWMRETQPLYPLTRMLGPLDAGTEHLGGQCFYASIMLRVCVTLDGILRGTGD